ncbi:MAG: TIGR04348 family glycosyltransferase [Burkholderiaceae bacterium]|nr:TIGR04348 family glycosyltransferase [Burkholderiaceae bacterium]
MSRIRIVIVSPALADANNGNWQTARRWQRLLSGRHSARIVRDWTAGECGNGVNGCVDQVMLALHARRSAGAIEAWVRAHAGRGLAVVMTGTDLYRDISIDARARQSLVLAQRIVVLQPEGIGALPADMRAKATVIFQSTSERRTLPKSARQLKVVMVGHLRDEKDPLTLMAAARALRDEPGIAIDHIGAPLDPELGRAAQDTAAACPRYRWLGGLPHEATRRHIQRAHLLVNASRMEGGAHVVMEAVRSGTPVLASRISGNVGMLGDDYDGYFELGDSDGLAALLRRCRSEQALPEPSRLLTRLRAQCARRASLFSPDGERAALLGLVDSL